MCKFSSKSGVVPFQHLGDLTWNDPQSRVHFGWTKQKGFPQIMSLLKSQDGHILCFVYSTFCIQFSFKDYDIWEFDVDRYLP